MSDIDDRAGQTWVWKAYPEDRIFLVLGRRTPVTHWLLDLESGEQTYVWENVLATFSKTWSRLT